MKVNDLVSIITTSEIMPINILQPGATTEDEPEHIIQIIPPELVAIKDEVADADIESVEIKKIAGGSIVKPSLSVEINIMLTSRVTL